MKKEKEARPKRKPTFLEAISIIIVLLLLFGYGFIGDISSPAIMTVAICYCTFISYRCGFTWSEIEEFAGDKIKKSASAMLILICVGFLIGAWMYSGTIPLLIYYGVQIVSEKWILASSFMLCALFSLATGTSNGSIGTAGLAMMGIAMGMPRVNLLAVAGACYTGAMFGDKLSPLSDSTILSSVVTENDMFEHIRHSLKTIVPAALIGLVIYVIMGISTVGGGGALPQETIEMLSTLDNMFHWNILLLLPVVIVVWGALTKKSSSVVMLVSSLVAIILGVVIQGFRLSDGINALYNGFSPEIAANVRDGFQVAGMSEQALTLVKRGGLSSMLKPFILVYICFYFASMMDQTGAMEIILHRLLASVKNRLSLVIATAVSGILLIMISGGSTLAILMTGEMFNEKYRKMGLSTLNLSRSLVDFCTGAAGFIPWTASGSYYAAIFGMSGLAYLPYCFMSYLNWLISFIFAATGIAMKPLEEERKAEYGL